MPPELSVAPNVIAGSLPDAWRKPLRQLALAWAGLIALTWPDWAEMAHQWWDASTYNHVLLIPLILAWLVRLRWSELAALRPQAFWPAIVWFAGGLLAWTVGSAEQINLVAELGAVMLLQAGVVALLGPKVAVGVLFPLGYMLFLVPFGDEIVPWLQHLTAQMAVGLTQLSGVPASLHGVLIDTPVGRFEVAQACSGVKFLIAMIALGALVAHLGFRSARRQGLFMLACCVVPVLANGVRAWGTIYIAQSQGVAFAAGFDHIFYGWIFFAIVMGLLLGVAWRFFDRDANDRLVDAAAIETSPLLEYLSRFEIGGWRMLAAMLLPAAFAGLWGAVLLRPLAEGVLAAMGAHP